MLTKDDIESFLVRLGATGATYSEVEPGLLDRAPERGERSLDRRELLAARRAAARQGHDAADGRTTAAPTLNRRLLELNATDLLHGSYGIQDDRIVLTEALELVSTSTIEEFLASLREHDARARVAPARARLVPRGTLSHGHLRPTFDAAASPNINDLISSAEDPEKMLNADPRRHARPAREGQAAGGRRDRRREAPARPGRRRVQAVRRTGSSARCSPSRKGATTSPSRRSSGRASTLSTAQQLEHTWETHQARDREAQELAARPERQDRGGEAQEEPAPRPPAPRAGAEAHRRDDVVALREVARSRRSPGWRSASSTNERQIKASRRDRRGVHRRHARSSDFKQLEKGAVLDVSVDMQLLALKQKMGMLAAPARPQQSKALGARHSATRRPCTPRSSDADGREEGALSVTRDARRVPVRADPHGDRPHRPAALAVREVADVFLLLFLGDPDLAVPRGAVRTCCSGALRLPARLALARGGRCSRSAASSLLFWLLVPPVVEQTQQLVRVLPQYIESWESGDRPARRARSPRCSDVWRPGEHKLLHAVYEQVAAPFGDVVPKVVGIVHAAHQRVLRRRDGASTSRCIPALYREWLIALFPPIHRDLVRDVLTDLRDYAARLHRRPAARDDLPRRRSPRSGCTCSTCRTALTFGVFTGLVAIVPFFGTLVSTPLPALFVLGGAGSAASRALMRSVVARHRRPPDRGQPRRRRSSCRRRSTCRRC